MATKCTVFSVGEGDFKEVVDEPDTSLPRYDDLTSRIALTAQTPMLELGASWEPLHYAFGDHPATHPLGFLASGGEAVPALDDGEQSSGRYFPPARVKEILDGLQRTPDHDVASKLAVDRPAVARLDAVDGLRLFDQLTEFLADASAAGRGIVVHLFR
jgi:hypothetical protein